MDILDRIDSAIGCQQCGGSLSGSVSDDFCSEDCQVDWHRKRAGLPRVDMPLHPRVPHPRVPDPREHRSGPIVPRLDPLHPLLPDVPITGPVPCHLEEARVTVALPNRNYRAYAEWRPDLGFVYLVTVTRDLPDGRAAGAQARIAQEMPKRVYQDMVDKLVAKVDDFIARG